MAADKVSGAPFETFEDDIVILSFSQLMLGVLMICNEPVTEQGQNKGAAESARESALCPQLMRIEANRWNKIHQLAPGEFRRQPHAGSCFDSKRGQLIVFGSDSHGKDFSNAPLLFDPVQRKWSRPYPDDGFDTYRVNAEGVPVAGVNGNHPWAMHTFGAVVYDSSRDEMLVTVFDEHLVPGRFTHLFNELWPKITRRPTWVYRVQEKEWFALPGEGISCFPYCAVYDSDRKVVVAVRSDGIFELTGDSRSWHRVTTVGHFGWHTNCVYDRLHRAVLVFGSNENRNDIAAYFPKSGEYKLLPTVGKRPSKDQHNPMEFHPDLGKTVVLVDNVAADHKQTETWLYDLGKDSWSQIASATLPFATEMNYMMEFDPGHRILLLVTGGYSQPTCVWALRLEDVPQE